jgi:D-amino-acid dehydrogenase
MTGSPDVVVVGGGAIGAACALELAQRGARVEVLERGDGWATGCSAGNAGLIVPSHATPLATPSALRDGLRWLGREQSPFGLRPRPALIPWLGRFVLACGRARARPATELVRTLAVASLARWAALAPEALERRGVLNVYASDAGFAEGRGEAAAYAAAGLRCEVLDARAARELEPSLHGPVAGAVLYPDEAHGDPLALVAELGAAAHAAGARLRTRTDVRGLRRGGGVVTAAGDVRAGSVVLAAGVGTRRLGVRLPVVAGIGCSIDLREGLARPSRPVFLYEGRVVATPLPDRLRLAGTLELAPADAPLATRRAAGVAAAARRGLAPHGGWQAATPWAGARPCAPDGLPIVGALPGSPSVVVATAHAMLGLTLAPVTGQLVADALEGHAPPPELAPARFRVAGWRERARHVA